MKPHFVESLRCRRHLIRPFDFGYSIVEHKCIFDSHASPMALVRSLSMSSIADDSNITALERPSKSMVEGSPNVLVLHYAGNVSARMTRVGKVLIDVLDLAINNPLRAILHFVNAERNDSTTHQQSGVRFAMVDLPLNALPCSTGKVSMCARCHKTICELTAIIPLSIPIAFPIGAQPRWQYFPKKTAETTGSSFPSTNFLISKQTPLRPMTQS